MSRYTCVGKGGEYESLGYAKPSGALRTVHGESGIIVYRDTTDNQLYFRDPGDFQQRMVRIKANDSATATDAEMSRYAPDPYRKAVATMVRRDCSNPERVVFHFKDGSTLAFKKTYEIEPS